MGHEDLRTGWLADVSGDCHRYGWLHEYGGSDVADEFRCGNHSCACSKLDDGSSRDDSLTRDDGTG